MADFKLLKEMQQAMQPKKTTEPYDTTATVRRIEGSTAWVHIPGGVDETPVELTINAVEGDVVRVRVSGGQAWLVGNNTAPPTDDTKAVQAAQTAIDASDKASAAAEAAEVAIQAADVAEAAAGTATTAANSALTQLSVVEDVVGTLNWISDHGTYTATSDTAVIPGKLYFTRSGSGTTADPYVYTVVTTPASDPAAAGYYELSSIDEAVSNYVASHLALTDEGLWVVPTSSGYKVLIATGAGSTYTAAGTYIVNASGVTVAFFGSDVVIGETGANRVKITKYLLQLIDKNNNVYFSVKDHRDSSGYAEMKERYVSDGTSTIYTVHLTPLAELVSVTVDGTNVTSSCTYNQYGVTFSSAPANGSIIEIKYKTQSTQAKSYTAGIRYELVIGGMSFVEGSSNVAGGFASHAEGQNSEAMGFVSHAEGDTVKAHGTYSHAEGANTEANSFASHAQGYHTNAYGQYQTVMGLYNVVKDVNLKDYALIIGNGTADNARSNALAIDWHGDIEMALNTAAASGTTDGDLYAAITALGWEGEVIV